MVSGNAIYRPIRKGRRATHRFDVEDGDVVQERTEGDAHDVGGRDAIFDIQRPLVHDDHRTGRHDKKHRR